MRFLVTGGAGFIGSHIVDALIERGDEVVVLDNLETGKKENLNPKAEFRFGDIRDLAAIMPCLRGVDGVFHTAALARIQPSFGNPQAYVQTNAMGTYNLMQAARFMQTKRIVYSGSSSAYGDAPMPTSEAELIPSLALHPYGSTKRMGEMLVQDLGSMTGGPESVILRYFNVYGPRQNTDADGPYPTVIGLFLGLLEKGRPLTVVPDGYQCRDFTWVGDIVQANLLAMSSDKVGKAEIINVGYGKNYTIWDVARAVLELDSRITDLDMIASGECVLAPQRRGEVRKTLASIDKAKELLGYEPTIDLPQGIKLAKEFLKNNK